MRFSPRKWTAFKLPLNRTRFVAFVAVFIYATNLAGQTPEWSVLVAPPSLSRPFTCASTENAAQLTIAAEGVVRGSHGDVFAISCPAETPGSAASTSSSAFSVVRLNAATGNEIWRQNFLGIDATFYSTFRNFIALDASGDVIAASSLFSDETGEFTYVIKYSAATGQKHWQTLLSAPSFAIEPLASGNVRINQGNVSQTVYGATGAIAPSETATTLPNRGGVPLLSDGIAYVPLTSADGLVRRVAKYLNAAPPGVPTITSGFIGGDIVSLSFLPPSTEGGAPILDYRLTCHDAGNISSAFTRTAFASPATSTLSFDDNAHYWQSVSLQCYVQARNLFGYGDISVKKTFFQTTAQFALMEAVSRKVHTGSGSYDLPITRGIAASGSVTIEPRMQGAAHLIAFQFNDRIIGFSNVTIAVGTGPATPATDVTSFENELRVSLPVASVPDSSRVRIGGNVSNALVAIAFAESVGFLLGDSNNTRTVDQTDVTAIRARSGQRVSPENFRFDINLSGAIGASDVLGVRGRTGRSLGN